MDLFGKKEIESLKEEIKTLKENNNNLLSKNHELQNLLTPELLNYQTLLCKTNELHLKIDKAESQIANLTLEIKNKNKELNELEKDIIVANETIELESFSLYTPKWSFTNSEEYKAELKKITDEQKRMIKNGTAANGNMGWTVNNNKSQGQKLVKDMIKLCLRSFNNECDASISAVKFNNYDRCKNRIYKAAESVNKLGKIMDVYINSGYINLRIKELQLALEYEIKKQEEKERLKDLRAKEREAEKARKEMEAARKVAEKEQTHYENALLLIEDQLKTCTDESKKIELLSKREELSGHLSIIKENLKELDYREANIKAGYVYIISNIGAFGKDIYKIGMTRRLDPQDRVDELGDASVPFNFDVHAMIFSDDAPALEAILHKEFENKRVNMINNRKEFFNVTLDEIKSVVHSNYDKVVEFIDNPTAEQYRESLKIKELKAVI